MSRRFAQLLNSRPGQAELCPLWSPGGDSGIMLCQGQKIIPKESQALTMMSRGSPRQGPSSSHSPVSRV